jgi:hypothetical protein
MQVLSVEFFEEEDLDDLQQRVNEFLWAVAKRCHETHVVNIKYQLAYDKKLDAMLYSAMVVWKTEQASGVGK